MTRNYSIGTVISRLGYEGRSLAIVEHIGPGSLTLADEHGHRERITRDNLDEPIHLVLFGHRLATESETAEFLRKYHS